jgi:hypothetical protein
MRNSKLLALSALFLSAQASARDVSLGRELYDSLVQCAAFHTVEAGMTHEGGDAAASHLATAHDYRADARKHSPDGQSATADADVKTTSELYRKMIAEGDAEDMAKSWTSLESACRELHIAKGPLAAEAGMEKSR